MTDLTHERCSEQLRPLLRGELDAQQAAAVRAHLETCPGCTEEFRGVERLLAGEVEPLTELEQARLRRALEAADADLVRERVVTPAVAAVRTEPAWRRRLAPVVGIAAALLLGLAGIAYLGSGGDDDGADRAVGEMREEEGQIDAFGGAGGGGAPRPRFEVRRERLTTRDIARLGRRSSPLVMFARAYDAEDAEELADRFVADLAEEAAAAEPEAFGRGTRAMTEAAQNVDGEAAENQDAPAAASAPVAKDAAADTLQRCAAPVLERYPALPAYAAYARLNGRRVLLIGFVWTERSSGPLNRFMIWAWPIGSCDAPVAFQSGEIRP